MRGNKVTELFSSLAAGRHLLLYYIHLLSLWENPVKLNSGEITKNQM